MRIHYCDNGHLMTYNALNRLNLFNKSYIYIAIFLKKSNSIHIFSIFKGKIMDRVKFYSENDMSIGLYGNRLKTVIENIRADTSCSLLDVLELYNILKFFNHNIYLIGMSDSELISTRNLFNKKIAIFFNNQNKQEIITYLEFFFSDNASFARENFSILNLKDIDKYTRIQYKMDFIECFEKYSLDQKISEMDLSDCFNRYKIPIWYFLKSTYFNDKYPQLLKSVFLSNPDNFELIIRNYTLDKDHYVIPQNITKSELYDFCERYIESDTASINYIELIAQGIRGFKAFTIDARLKLKASRKFKQIEQKYFQENDEIASGGFVQKISIYTNKKSYFEASNNEFNNLVDVDYLKNHSNPESLLEYLMYLDGYFNGNWILDLCSFPNFESSTFVRALSGIRTKSNYETTFIFSCKNKLLLLTFQVFQKELGRLVGLRIEDLITFFFDTYCRDNFDITWIPLTFANKDESINIQSKNLFTIEEQLRKQWKLFIEDEKIDMELFQLESTPPIASLKSLLNKKYIYQNESNQEIGKIMFLLFSDQSNLAFINKKFDDDSFSKLICKNKINYSLFQDYQKSDVNFLVEKNIVSVNNDNVISATNKQKLKISILSDIFDYGVINYYNGSNKISLKDAIKIRQDEIDELISDDFLRFENTLFAKPEVDFLNYVLNDSKFDNSLSLRNKYLHGSVIEDNKWDYFYALIILVAYVIKINEELTLNSVYN